MKLDMDSLIGTGVRYTVAGRDNKLKSLHEKLEAEDQSEGTLINWLNGLMDYIAWFY